MAPSPERQERLGVRLDALGLPVDPLEGAPAQNIEILIVAACKDFELLRLSSQFALLNSGNPVSHMTFVVPEANVAEAWKIATALTTTVPMTVTSEDDLIPRDTRSQVRKVFGDRYGWVLQQLLCVTFVAESREPGVLVLDADTLMLRPRTLLSGNRQVLMRSLEHHQPYFDFLESLDPRFTALRGSHVTHHMLQQPDVMRRILAEFCNGDVAGLAGAVIGRAVSDPLSGVSIDFELYAQGLMTLFPDRYVEAKWCNATIEREAATTSKIEELSAHYASVSLHDYL